MIQSDCPTDEDLSRYAAGALSDGEAQPIDAHLIQCTLCLSRLDTLASHPDPIVAALRRPTGPAAPDSPALAKAVAAVLAGNTHPTDLPASEAAIGTVVSGYQILEHLGHGGMGRVYRARHPRLDQEVAIKVLRPGFESAQFLARFEAERQALALMDHPHIARVSDGGVTEDGQPYFVMELVRGTAITSYCEDHGLDLRRRLELFIQVCQAVQHAHQKGMIHRDLKPSNVLVAEYDGKPVPKIIDFGIAKAVAGHSAVETEIGMLVGTPEYMSPEQAGLSSRDMDTRSDVYALGVLLYELLTGDTPLARQRVRVLPVLEVLRLIREEDPPAPSHLLTATKSTAETTPRNRSAPGKLAKQVRGELDWIVLKALDKDRDRRYETAAALADDVRRFSNDEIVLAGPPSKTYRLRKFARRYRRVLATAAAFVLLLLAGVVISTWLAVRAMEAQTQAEIDRDKAVTAEQEAKDSAAEALSVLNFFQVRILAVGRPEGQEGGLGREVTIRKAVDAAEPRIAEAFQGQPLVEASVRNTLGMTYIYVGDPAAAITQFERAWELRRDHHGPDHADTLVSMHDLGVACELAGQLDRGQSLLEQVWQKRKTQLGADHRDTLRSMNQLAVAYLAAGKLDQAADLAARAVADHTAKLGADHIDTLLATSCLASADQAAGRLKQAVALFEKVVEGMTTQVGGEHPHTLAAMNNLGLAYRAAGQLDRAVPLFSKVMEIQKSRLGPDHLHTLTSMHNLALVYSDQEQADKAIPLLLQVLEGRNTKLSPDHPNTLKCMHSLAVMYQKTGQASRAFPLLERVLEASKTKLGADHPDTLQAMNNLAALNFFAGKVDRAIALHQETLKLRKAKFGVEHQDTLISMNNLAYCYWKAKKIDLAIDLFQQTVKGRSAVLGSDHPQTLGVLITLSVVYRDVGQLDRALLLLEQAHEDRKSRLGADHRDTRHVARELASIQSALGHEYLQQQKFVEAEAVLRPALKIREQQPDAWTTFSTRSLLGGALLGQKKYAEAEPLLVGGYEGMKQREAKIPAKARVRLTESLERMVQLYDAWGKKAEAAKWRKLQPAKPGISRID